MADVKKAAVAAKPVAKAVAATKAAETKEVKAEVKKEEKTTISCSPYGRHALREAAKFTNK